MGTGSLLTIFGLILDMAGASLVSIDLFLVFKGPESITIPGLRGIGRPDPGFMPNNDYERHQKTNLKWAKSGFGLLFLGFLFQLLGAIFQ